MTPIYVLTPTPPPGSAAADLMEMLNTVVADTSADPEKFGNPASVGAVVYVKGGKYGEIVVPPS